MRSPKGAGLINATGTTPRSLADVTGNCATPTTLVPLPSKEMITAPRACIRRQRMAIVRDGAIPLRFDGVIRSRSRCAHPNLRVRAKVQW